MSYRSSPGQKVFCQNSFLGCMDTNIKIYVIDWSRKEQIVWSSLWSGILSSLWSNWNSNSRNRTTWFFWSYPYRAVLTSQNLLWIWHFFQEKLNFLTLDLTSFLGYSIYASHLSHFIGKAILRKVGRFVGLETIETSWTDSLVLDKVRVIKQKTHWLSESDRDKHIFM